MITKPSYQPARPIEYEVTPFTEKMWRVKSSEEPILRVFLKLQDAVHHARKSAGLREAVLIVNGVVTELR